jgi:prolyl-tRNA synthetase
MKLSNTFFYTLRENVKDEDSTSGNWLVRAGYIRKSSSGVYMYLPLGFRVLKKIEQLIRDEMQQAGAQEVLMPALISEEVFVESGRRNAIGSSMFSLKDRFGKPFVLGPTHEELFAMAASMKIRSYKDLPFNLYQFQDKFRDEPRPRYGLIRVREFIMKDAYSFDRDLDGLAISYDKMFKAYQNSFDRMGLNYKVVKADTGVMGGLLSEEFQAVTAIGEDVLVLCDQCDFASNIEVAPTLSLTISYELHQPYSKVYTPHVKTIAEVADFLNLSAERFVKTLLYQVDDQVVACLVRGDQEVNETKVRKLLGANDIQLASAEVVTRITQAQVGFAGPINISIPVIVDQTVAKMHNFITGANETDHHYINVNMEDFKPSQISDIANIREGDICPQCGGKIYFAKGIEVGNTFKLGTKYSKAMNLQYLDETNQLQDVVMGSYGIGIGRCMAAIAEQYADENGLVWPKSVAPYQVAIVIISMKDEQQVQQATALYHQLLYQGIEVLLDDRDERPGVKFKDLDLIGIPLRIVVGKHISDGLVEVKARQSSTSELMSIETAINSI